MYDLNLKIMKKCLFSILILIPISVFSQVIDNISMDTNGPMGECLFKQDDKGNIIYSDVIQCNFKSDTIMGLAKEFLYDAKKKYSLDTKDYLNGITKISCKIEMSVGNDTIDLKKFEGLTGVSMNTIVRDASKISFLCTIEIRNYKYKYTLSDFCTKRRMIHGEGKSEGPSNIIHWQRINSLMKERAPYAEKLERNKAKYINKKLKEEIDEYDKQIALEKTNYQQEFDAVMNFIKGIRSFVQIKDF
jgi:hypothetical protein